MGIILSALAAAGNAGVSSIDADLAQMRQSDAMAQQNKYAMDQNAQRSSLEEQKERAIMQAKADIANAPTVRAGELVRASSKDMVMDQAPDPTETNGDYVDKDGVLRHGVAGKFEKMRADVMAAKNLSPDDRAYALDQINRQYASALDVAQSDNQMRYRTTDEAMQDAIERAKSKGDLQALAALKASIPDKTMTLKKDETVVDAANPSKVLASNTLGTDHEIMKINADRAAQEVKGRQEAMLRAMQLDPLGINAPPGGYAKAISSGADTGSTAPAADAAGSGSSIGERIQGKTGDALMAELPPPIAARVKAILDGRESFPSTARNNPRNAQLLDLAAQVDPDFDAVNFNKRNKTAIGFATGKQGDAVRAANQAIAHAGSLYDSIDSLNNFSGMATPANYIVNPVEKFFGDSRQGVFEQKAIAVASELRKVFAGAGGGGITELKAWEDSLPVNGSKTAQKAYLQSGMELLHGAIDQLQSQYEDGMGKTVNRKSLINPKAQTILDKIYGKATATDSSDPINSAVRVYDPATGTFH